MIASATAEVSWSAIVAPLSGPVPFGWISAVIGADLRRFAIEYAT
jgi:hypothetical protein